MRILPILIAAAFAVSTLAFSQAPASAQATPPQMKSDSQAAAAGDKAMKSDKAMKKSSKKKAKKSKAKRSAS